MLAITALAAIPAPAGAAARISGRWAVTVTPLNYQAAADHVTWRTSPACRRGACSFTARSDSGTRYRFRLLPDGRYRAQVTFPREDCKRADGTVVLADAYAYVRVSTLRVTSSVRGQARRFTGLSVDREIASSAATAAGCAAGKVWRKRLTGVLR